MRRQAWRLPEAAVDARPTFLSHALASAALHGPGPWPHGGYPLPDEDPDEVRVMSGAVEDGVRTHHFRFRPDEAGAAETAEELERLVGSPPTTTDLAALHDRLAAVDTLTIADPLTAELRRRSLPRDRLREIALRLTGHGTRRNAVATGIVLLGLSGDERDRELLLVLGTLEDLSLYAVVALLRSQPEPPHAVFELARRVDGWGRIHAVERLAGTGDPEIRSWLLREGFRNGVTGEYLAHLAATTGGLYAALLDEEVDDALLDGAGDILETLAGPAGPAKNIEDYPDGPPALCRYVALVRTRPPHPGRVTVLLRLAKFLDTEIAASLDWDERTRSALRETCLATAKEPGWRATVASALAEGDLPAFRNALWPARQLGIAVGEHLRWRLRAHPDDGYLWQCLLDEHPAHEIAEVVAFAQELLPLPELVTGPATDPGFGRDRAFDRVLGLLVNHLAEHPGQGGPLLGVALANRLTGNRNTAARALAAWPAESVPPEMRARVREAHHREPDPDTKKGLRELLDSWS
ncbi:hypothetical protein FNH05_28330 [Amycolatopsis rhizosphaerae]|uniref:Uncharacterized protein n=1 Tax=Amycolatopsis rhizosphaerae TaxID=2053003 RepID=A0A558B4Q3_9PSEU|nr:hypothetical protein [Amycolatopsis rhizosphaerae]TVT31494.1 hypothetical protein FNH05_28330 [Amycolatopsis rhizosphaerae]